MLLPCPQCQKLYSDKGLHTHIARTHGSIKEKSKYSNGHNGKYQNSDYKKNVRAGILKRYNIFDEERSCPHCHKVFTVLSSSTKKFCSISCSTKYSNIKRYGVKRLKPPRKLAPVETRTCVVCGNSFEVKVYDMRTTCSSQCARKHPNCGGKRNSRKFPYKGVILDSSYELELARSLDWHGITWVRPKFVNYNLNGKIKRYHPDFFLPEYNVYLDPKNDYLIQKDKEKITLVETQNSITIIVLPKHQLKWKKVLELIKHQGGGVAGT